MRAILAIFAAYCLCSCAGSIKTKKETDPIAGTVKQEVDAKFALGGKGAFGADGSFVYDNEKSFDTAAMTAGAAYAAYQAAKSFAASEATKQAETRAATRRHSITANKEIRLGRQAASIEKAQIHAATPTQ